MSNESRSSDGQDNSASTGFQEQKVGGAPAILIGLAFVGVLAVAIIALLIITGQDIKETPAPAQLSSEAQAGKALFLNADKGNCGGCHPSEGRRGGTGPRLSSTVVSDATIAGYIRNGKGTMPAVPASRLSDDDIAKIITYIRAIKA